MGEWTLVRLRGSKRFCDGLEIFLVSLAMDRTGFLLSGSGQFGVICGLKGLDRLDDRYLYRSQPEFGPKNKAPGGLTPLRFANPYESRLCSSTLVLDCESFWRNMLCWLERC